MYNRLSALRESRFVVGATNGVQGQTLRDSSHGYSCDFFDLLLEKLEPNEESSNYWLAYHPSNLRPILRDSKPLPRLGFSNSQLSRRCTVLRDTGAALLDNLELDQRSILGCRALIGCTWPRETQASAIFVESEHATGGLACHYDRAGYLYNA